MKLRRTQGGVNQGNTFLMVKGQPENHSS